MMRDARQQPPMQTPGTHRVWLSQGQAALARQCSHVRLDVPPPVSSRAPHPATVRLFSKCSVCFGEHSPAPKDGRARKKRCSGDAKYPGERGDESGRPRPSRCAPKPTNVRQRYEFGRFETTLQCQVLDLLALLRKSLIFNGAGEGNRTLISGLGSPHSTTEPHPLPLG